MTATTALTAQNTTGVIDVHVTPPSFVAKQIDACATDIGIDVVKTGMLASAETIKVVAHALKTYDVRFSVIDPVMVSTSGHQLLPEDAVETLLQDLLPETSLLTPNIPEATLILRQAGLDPGALECVDDLKRIAQQLSTLGPKAVLVKGGHCPMNEHTLRVHKNPSETGLAITNVLYTTEPPNFHVFTSPHISSRNTHGTGCSLASAIASNLCTLPLLSSVSAALSYVSAAIRLSEPLGSGSGPINHFHSLQRLPFSPGSFISYLLSHPLIQPAWREFTHHPFVVALGDGTLPRPAFEHYMKQDYLYLTHFARANSLAGYKASSLASTAASARIVALVQRETALHVAECEAMGISRDALECEEEDLATVAYSRFLLDTGVKEDWFALQIALAPCLIGYGVVAARLHRESLVADIETETVAKDGPVEAKSEGARLVARLLKETAALEGDSAARKTKEQRETRARSVAGPNPYTTWIRNYGDEDYIEAIRVGAELIEAHAVRQSPARIQELVRIFLTATKMETAFWDMGLNAGEPARR